MFPSLVSASWLNTHLDDPKLVILDASIPAIGTAKQSEFAGIQLPRARFFDLKKTFSDREQDLPNMLPSPEQFSKACQTLGIHQDSKIVVYDNLGVYSSPRVWWMFRAMGHEQVAVLNGGLPAWMAHEFPHESVQQYEWKLGSFLANFQSDWVWNQEQVKENIDTQQAKVIDARSTGRFNGTNPEPRAGLKSGHVPHSQSLPHQEVVENGHFLDIATLKSKFEQFQPRDQRLVFTCGSGLTACILAFASHLVQDNPIAIYDGSWSEWGLLDDTFIAKA